jgi:hypothetical protein
LIFRWYILKGRFLYMYNGPEDAAPQSHIALLDARSAPWHESKKQVVFTLTTEQESYAFEVTHPDELQGWIDDIREAGGEGESGAALQSKRAAGGAVLSDAELARRVAALRALPGTPRRLHHPPRLPRLPRLPHSSASGIRQRRVC